MDVVVAQDVLVCVLQVYLFDLECRVVDSFLPADLRQFHQHVPLTAFHCEYVSDQDGFTWAQVPYVQVMDIYDSLNSGEGVLEFGGVDVVGGRFHDDLVAILGDGPGREDDDEGEDVSGDGVQVVPVVELSHGVAHLGAHEEDDQG